MAFVLLMVWAPEDKKAVLKQSPAGSISWLPPKTGFRRLCFTLPTLRALELACALSETQRLF